MDRQLWKIEWKYVTAEYIMADADFIWANDRQDAIERFWAIEDVPEDAEILLIEIA